MSIIETLTDETTRSPLTAHIFQFLRLAGRHPKTGKRATLPQREPRGPTVNPQAASGICSAQHDDLCKVRMTSSSKEERHAGRISRQRF